MQLFPTGGPRPTSSEAERAFYRALLAQLPKGWRAWHSLRLRAGGTWEGEGDFVIAVPDRAIVVVEVKGGAIECRDGRWLQNGKPMRQAPRDQAHRLRRLLEKKLDEVYRGARPPILIATAFPGTPFQVAPSHGDLTGAVLGQQDLPWLGAALEALVDKQLGETPAVKDDGWSSALHRLWGETWIPRVSLGTRIQLRERELVTFDADQVALLDMLEHSRRLLVMGGPGTGKTLLARELCERRSPVLYLCWTRALAVAMRASGVQDAWPVREYAARLLRDAGIEIEGGARPDVWSNETWEHVALHAAIDAALPGPAEYAMIVVDEAQDFTEGDWELAKAVAGDGAFWAFGDGGQSFWPERAVPRGLFGAELVLKARYRCPEPLAAFADRYRTEPATARASGAERVEPLPELRVVRAEPETVLERTRAEVARAMRDGVRPEDIAILSLRGQSKSDVVQLARLGDVPLARADAPEAAERVVADTFLRFKGLERPYVIVTELDADDKYDVRMHVALTRATLQATVVATSKELDADPRLAALSP